MSNGAIGCYTLDLYCDNQNDAVLHDGYKEFPVEYCHEFGSKARMNARRDGWRIDKKNHITLCPSCNKSTPPSRGEKNGGKS